jgi:enoyl-CoA hydratase
MDLKAWMHGDKPFIEGRGFGGITITPPRKPLIAAVEGFALAGGFELMLACDLVVAANGSKFGVPEVKRALVAGGGAALLLPRRIPFAAAMELLLTGAQITAARAADLGLVNRLVPDGTALDGALALAELVAANGPLAVAVTKQIARAQADWTVTEGWQRQEELLKPVFESADAREGATAFAEKRPPVWRGVLVNEKPAGLPGQGGQRMAVKFRAGQQLVSAVDSTAVIVIKAPAAECTVTCGGVAMAAAGGPVTAAEPDPTLLGGTQIGKRYVDDADTIQLLCTKAGQGTLALDGSRLQIQAAKPLPASD